MDQPKAGAGGRGAEGDLRERLIDVGVELLEAEGLSEVTLRSITRAAGVSHGAPRRHFATFGGLLAAMAARGLADLDAAVRPPLEGPGPVPERIAAAVDAYLDFARRRPHMFTLVFRHDLLEGSGLRLRERSLPILDALTGVLADDAHDPAAARVAALAIWTQAHGIAALGLTRALDLAATTDERRTLVAAAVQAHLAPWTAPKHN